MCHYQPASSHHFRLQLHLPTLVLFPSLSLSVSPPLLVLYVPPTPCVTAAGEGRKMLGPTNVEEKTVKRVKGSEGWSVFAARPP